MKRDKTSKTIKNESVFKTILVVGVIALASFFGIKAEKYFTSNLWITKQADVGHSADKTIVKIDKKIAEGPGCSIEQLEAGNKNEFLFVGCNNAF